MRILRFTMLILLLAASAPAQDLTFGATLTGSQEVPPADPDGFGTATVTLNPTRDSITIRVTVSRIGTVSASHIHEQVAGQNGGVVVGIGTNYTNGQTEVTAPISMDLGNRIAANPAGFYVNVHTAAHPGGAIRGQLALINTSVLGNDLLGSREVPAAGHPTAIGAFTIAFNEARDQLTFEVISNVPNATAAHIHRGIAGQPGPVELGLATSATAFTNGRIGGTIPITTGLATEILTAPQFFYVNVHSTEFPGGAVRGQIGVVNESDIAVAGRVANALGETFVSDVRIVNPSYTVPVIVFLERFATGTTNNRASHTGMVQVPPRGTEVIDDLMSSTIFQSGSIGAPINGTAAVRLTSPGRIIATSRIYADKRASNQGTIGQFFPALARSSALRRGILPQLSHTPVDPANLRGYRTNLGFFNPNDVVATVRIEVRDATATIVASTVTTLGPKQHVQNGLMGGWFSDTTERANLTVSFDANVPIFGYASVLDNVSTDPIAVLAQEDPEVSTAP